VERVWLPEWLADSRGVLDRLAAAVEVAAAAWAGAAEADRAAVDEADRAAANEADRLVSDEASEPAEPDRGSAPPAADTAVGDDPAATRLPGETLFTPWLPGTLGSRDVLDQLPGPAAARQVSKALADAVDAEGPIQIDRLVHVVAAGFGLHRVLAARHAAILTQLPAGLIADPAAPEFAWPESLDPLAWSGFRRTPPGVERPLEQISPREIGNAMVSLCGAAAGMTVDQLWAGTLQFFGFNRRSAAQVVRLETALQLLLDSGRLAQRADGVLMS
jgi:hypothetical protein